MKLTEEQVRAVHGFAWKYQVIERNGKEHMNFYYEEHEYEAYQQEITNALSQGVLIAYGARFMAR